MNLLLQLIKLFKEVEALDSSNCIYRIPAVSEEPILIISHDYYLEIKDGPFDFFPMEELYEEKTADSPHLYYAYARGYTDAKD